MFDLNNVGSAWAYEQACNLTEEIIHMSPVEFNELNRYLPKSVTPKAGYIRYQINPFMIEPLNNGDIDSPVRETIIMKGVQITYTTLLESLILYYMVHVGTVPLMLITAEKDLATARIENNIIPMINQSGFGDLIRSADETNKRKTGKTKDCIQWAGGCLYPFGANNAKKMRSFSIYGMFKDEIDGWPDVVGNDGDPDALSDDRCSAFWNRRKIFRGSTPLLKKKSKIYKQYLRGDQRKYMVLCRSCSYPQELRWSTVNKENGVIGGFKWETQNEALLLDSVCYRCFNCGHEHYEYDKAILFSPDHGAHWNPTANAVEEGIRSYHLPAMYSPVGMQPWSKCVSAYLAGYDHAEKKVKDIGKYQVFYNNILGWPFETMGSKVTFIAVSGHRRSCYRLGQIPNEFAIKYSGSPILVLTCAIDVHKSNLAVSVFGWTKEHVSYLVDYWRFEAKDENDQCELLSSSVWKRVRQLIEDKRYKDGLGREYGIAFTLIDAGYCTDTVYTFCAQYETNVHPIMGRSQLSKQSRVKEFYEHKNSVGTICYHILVDIYKSRLQPILKREWDEGSGQQKQFHFNAPIDTTDKQLKELTVEVRREKIDEKGAVSYHWHRPGNAPNELFDMSVYHHSAIDIIASVICMHNFKLEYVDWDEFWKHLEDDELFFKTIDV